MNEDKQRREIIASIAMNGILAGMRPDQTSAMLADQIGNNFPLSNSVAKLAVRLADDLMKELDK